MEGINMPTLLTPIKVFHYLKEHYGITTTVGSLAVKRCQKRGFRYTKINSRVYYRKEDIDREIGKACFVETAGSIG